MIGAILRSVARLAFRRTLTGGAGGRGWLVLGVAAVTLRVLHRHANQPKAYLYEKIEPGQSLVITHFPRLPKK